MNAAGEWAVALPLIIVVGGVLLVAVGWALVLAYLDIYGKGPRHDAYSITKHQDALEALSRRRHGD